MDIIVPSDGDFVPEGAGLPVLPGATPDLVALLLADKRSAATKRAYAGDLALFFDGAPTPEAVRAFVSAPVPEIALRLARWKERMLAAGLAEATVNRRLSAVRSLLKFARRLGLAATDGRGLVDSERATPYRDTRGIGVEGMRRLCAAPGAAGLKALRDRAILRLLCENALRRAEVCALDVEDFEPKRRSLKITGKGRGTQKERITLSKGATEALTLYLRYARRKRGPLFPNMAHDPKVAGNRLSTAGLYALVAGYGAKIGEKRLTPHKLRHSAITALLDATGGDIRKVQRFSRHVNVQTVIRYDDARQDFQGELTDRLSALLGD